MMRLAVLLLLVALACATLAHGQERRVYGSDGGYKGRVDTKGRFFAPDGRYLGNIREDGRLYAPDGGYRGRVDGQGWTYGPDGIHDGRITEKNAASGPDAARKTPQQESPRQGKAQQPSAQP